jgi:hypothetical protein
VTAATPRPAAFLSALQVALLDDTGGDGRGSWQLLAPLRYWSALLGQGIEVPAGFNTDFASVPRWIPIASALVGDRAHAAAVVHDYLYTVHSVTRLQADMVLREACAASGVPAWARWLIFSGVRVGGESHWTLPASPQRPAVAAQLLVDAAMPLTPG